MAIANQRTNIIKLESKRDYLEEKFSKWQSATERFADARFPGSNILAELCRKKANKLNRSINTMDKLITKQNELLAQSEIKALGKTKESVARARTLISKYKDKGYNPSERLTDILDSLEVTGQELSNRVKAKQNNGKSQCER